MIKGNKILIKLLVLLLSINLLATPVFASPITRTVSSIIEDDGIHYSNINSIIDLNEDDSSKSITSKDIDTYGSHVISSTIKTNKNGVKVSITNIGTDAVDSVSVVVEPNTGASPEQTPSFKLAKGATKTISFDMPMTLCASIYDVKITFREGMTYKTEEYTAFSEVTEKSLAAYKWNKGGKPTLQDAVDYHFKKHSHELPVYNIPDYLNEAKLYRLEILRDIDNDDMSNYRTSAGEGFIPSTKFKNLKDARFMILTNASSHEILSFGR